MTINEWLVLVVDSNLNERLAAKGFSKNEIAYLLDDAAHQFEWRDRMRAAKQGPWSPDAKINEGRLKGRIDAEARRRCVGGSRNGVNPKARCRALYLPAPQRFCGISHSLN
jgi:hypothetical protein